LTHLQKLQEKLPVKPTNKTLKEEQIVLQTNEDFLLMRKKSSEKEKLALENGLVELTIILLKFIKKLRMKLLTTKNFNTKSHDQII
jgi:hypothetical protein